MLPDLFSRRRLLALTAAALPALALLSRQTRGAESAYAGGAPGSGQGSGAPTVGIALGAGGANGLAHVLMLEALDELAIKPHRIAGSSMGAVIGALYASGMTARQIRELIDRLIISPKESLFEELTDEASLRWIEFLDIDLGHGGFLSGENFVNFLYETIQTDTFAELEIPLKIVAADLWHHTQVVLESGSLLSAIKASMALPGVFEPVELDGRTLIDGGTVNPVPYDLLMEECDIVIGIEVIGDRTIPKSGKTSYLDTIFNSVKVMQRAIMAEKLRRVKPDIYIAPEIYDIRALEFYRANEVYEQARPARKQLEVQLKQVLSRT